ncbi:MAG TPA: glycosyl hydrolase family 28-related protein, partial [Candidatus Babeliales bacterium]|nr:glycosyl hydrolase family 28-related protein [Candidatus Babeliales bacterium]
MSGVIKWILISIVTIGLTAGIAFFILVRPSLDDLHLEGLQKFITYLQSLSFTPAIGPEPGHIILFAKSTADFLSAVSLKGVDISINHVELEKQDGSWIAAATSSKNIQLLQHTDKDIGIPLSDIIIPADTYIGIRFSFGTTTVLTTASTTLTASMPSQVFEIPIHATVPSNGVSTVTLSVLPKESIFKNKNTYTFAPFAVLESRTDAQVFTSSDLKIVAAFNTGTLQELVQAQMYGNGQTQGVHLALAAERPPVIKKSSSTYSTGSGQNSSHTTGNTQNNLIYSIGTPTRPVSPPQQSVIPTAQPLPQPSNPLSNTSQPPVFDYQSSQNVHVGQLLTLIVHATSPTGQALTYGIGDIPGDADFDPDAQLFTWIPDTAGTYPAVFTATDGVNTISQTIIIVVTDPHAVNNPLQPPVTPPVTPPTQPLPPVQPPTNNPPGAIGTTFNVKNYGAKGDGTTDDINSINKAIADLVAAKGGTLYFPQGIYRISSTVEIDYLSNFKVIGTSATLKQVDGPYTNYYTISNMYLRSDSNFTIQGLTFDGDSQNRVRGEFAGNTLMIRGDSNFTITGNNFINSICDDIIMYADKPGDDSTAVHEGIVS